MKSVRRWQWLRRALRWFGIAVMLFVLTLIVDGWKAFGQRAKGARQSRMEHSPEWQNGHFENPQPLINDWWGALSGAFEASAETSPAGSLSPDPIDPSRFVTAPPTGLRVTWLGHAATLIEIDGKRILTDPVWSERASPFSWLGPRRWYRPSIALEDLPALDAVLISHDHYDHLDYRTIVALKDSVPLFVVPLGVAAHLVYWGVPESNIAELDWWEHRSLGALDIVCTPARHASGRVIIDDNATLWAGYALIGPQHRAYFSGDTGLFPALAEIGARLGPFDVTLIETGQYHRAWPDWHIGPEQAVVAHQMLRGRTLLPIHWGLFALAYHGWTEPVERAVAAAAQASVRILTPRPGQSLEPEAAPHSERWWPALPWETAAQSPIVSTGVR